MDSNHQNELRLGGALVRMDDVLDALRVIEAMAPRVQPTGRRIADLAAEAADRLQEAVSRVARARGIGSLQHRLPQEATS